MAAIFASWRFIRPAIWLRTPDRFEIDPRDHIAACKAARARGHEIIGCYHSHPNGGTSLRRAICPGAGEEDFLWLIAATASMAAFVYRVAALLASDCMISSE